MKYKSKRGRIRTRSHLYRLRRIRGYGQKHVAYLLGHKGTQMVSRYETGEALPPLETALLLQIIFGAQLADVYPDLYGQLQALAVKREAKLKPSLGLHIRGRVLGKD